MDKSLRFKHGEHNENLCDHLIKIGGFNDWVVTSAFYACVHFVEHKLFPAKVDGKEFKSFNDYYNFVRNVKKLDLSKHKLKVELVSKRIPRVGGQYRHLFGICSTARYSDYTVSDEKAKNAGIVMKIIKKECLK